MQVNPDPQKFDMQIAHGVKNAADVDEMGADAPDIAVPFCKAHGRWPCMDCGTKHFEGCECPYCMVPAVDPLEEVREAAGYAAKMMSGFPPTIRKTGGIAAKETADRIERYRDLLTKFSNGDL